jgi:protein-tyrosine phosphatase
VDATRHLYFEACFNFRDLGGYPCADGREVRWATLYRSDTLHRLTATDAESFRALGLRTVIDLRSSTEIDEFGRLDVDHAGVTWHNVPMLDNLKLSVPDPSDQAPPPAVPSTAGEGYLRIAEDFAPSVAEAFGILAREDALPAVFHCTSGKDRTGILAALVLGLLGVTDDVIASDYVLTQQARARSTPWIEANEPAFAAFLAQIPPDRRAIRPDRIVGFLDELRSKYGTVSEFLTTSGVTEKQLETLRDRLVHDREDTAVPTREARRRW